ncbi:target of rapamycin complex 2 subunit MAPKAP1 [Caerostris extrusa]|uniref:Target of rapamycin complex 2 subunit MAPKAP1 n=1 Tax=Caerostris extrusa TaxID=172846 RepID=A0AAV4Y2G4_CAEEX|nr:target of rapamycin complex 2 subunit MAPKAP1 [Caerostris extrusa]
MFFLRRSQVPPITSSHLSIIQMLTIRRYVRDEQCSMSVCTEKALSQGDSSRPEFAGHSGFTAVVSDFVKGGGSYDIVSGMGFIGGHRHRSNTAQRLEKLKKDRQNQAKITHIQWKECPVILSEQDLSQLFPKKDLTKPKENKELVKSALSEALELFPAAPNNPFGEYARFDGRVNRSAPSKKILIYLTMLPTAERNYGMEVICLSNARVFDLIGLICWMYTNEGREPKLKPSVSNYCLKIAEETGEIDEDFPSLDANEFVGKFGFPFLALIERETKNSSLSVTVYIDDGPVKFDVSSLNLSLRKLQIFRLIFEDDVKERMQRDFETDEYDAHMKAVEAPLYRSFNVILIQKMGLNYDVQLGISGEKVEINPLPPKGAAKLLGRQQKPATLYMDSIAACEIVSKNIKVCHGNFFLTKLYTFQEDPGKCIFKLIQQVDQEFKKYVFETDPPTAQDIVKKVQIIIEMHSTNACKEYQLYRERKLQKRAMKSQQSSSKGTMSR